MADLDEHNDGGSSIILDARLFPIAIATIYGRLSPSLVGRYFDWNLRQLNRARDEGVLCGLVIDCLDAERPEPSTRKTISSRAAELQELADTHSLGYSYIAVANALVRGTFTALRWVNPSLGIRMVADPKAALAAAIADLRARGTEISYVHPGDYERPPPALSRVG